MRLALHLHRAPAIGARVPLPSEVLGLATTGGARVLGRGAELGRLWAPLKQPGTDALPEDLLPVTWVPPRTGHTYDG